jgi:hypothetical protein
LFRYALQNHFRKKGTINVPIKTNGKERNRFTLALGVTAAGNKLPPFVIFRGVKPELMKKVVKPEGVVGYKNPTAWMDTEMLIRWIREVLKPWIIKTFGPKDTKNFLLLLDETKFHKSEDVRIQLLFLNVIPIYIPAGLTSLLQPLDISVNRSFKCHIRTLWNDLQDKTVSNSGSNQNTKIKTKPLVHEQTSIMTLIDQCWKTITQSVIVNGFRKSDLLI